MRCARPSPSCVSVNQMVARGFDRDHDSPREETLTGRRRVLPRGSNTWIHWDLLRGHQHQITDNERYGEEFVLLFGWLCMS